MAMGTKARVRVEPSDPLLKPIEELAAASGIAPARFALLLRKHARTLPDSARAFRNCQRFLSAGFTSSLLHDFVDQPVLLDVFLRLASQSQYLADILVRQPELLRWLMSTADLTGMKDTEQYRREAESAVAPFEQKDRRINALKRFHRREILRLGAREILGEAPGPVVAAELAHLADAVLEATLQIALRDLQQRHGSPVDPDLAVIGLGKLGGEELNFSSDIDLMFVYDADGPFESPADGIHTRHALCVRLAEQVTRMLSEHTDEGYLYRVDLRLRPDGQSGPLAMSRAAYLSYYETRGETWERQMLLKARCAAGAISVGERFLKDIEPFVFPRSRLRSPLEEIAAVKRRIEEKVKDEENIKLGAGGIRDIEFIVQGLQLVHAGERRSLRVRGTLPALERLAEAKLLKPRERSALRSAYGFLRRVEHRLQLLEGRQTHSLPATTEEIHALARRLAYRGERAFRTDLQRHQASVRTIYGRTIGITVEYGRRQDSKGRNRPRTPELPREVVDAFVGSGSADALVREIRRWRAPQWAIRNLTTLAGAEGVRRTLLHGMQHDRFREMIVRICSRSRWLTDLMAREPLFVESLAARPEEVLSSEIGWEFLRRSDPLRFRSFNEAKSVARFILGLQEISGLLMEISAIAETMLETVTADAVAAQLPKGRFAVVALGKLGSGEMTIGSDLDLVFVRGEGSGDVSVRADRAGKQILNALQTDDGGRYDVDLRLRPEGHNAPAVAAVDYLEQYFAGRADLWERQALLRARVVYGDDWFRARLASLIGRFAYENPLEEGWVERMGEMRQRIGRERSKGKKGATDLKVGEGGLMDIEFTVQSLQLRYGADRHEVREANTLRALGRIAEGGLLSPSNVRRLRENYLWLRTLEFWLRTNGAVREFQWPPAEEGVEVVLAAMNCRRTEELERKLNSVRRVNRSIFTETLRQCER